MAVPEKFYSADDLMRLSFLPENKLKHLELKDGVLIETPIFGWRHGNMCAVIGYLIGRYAITHDIGRITAGGTGYVLHKAANGRDTVRAPDLAFIRTEHMPPEGFTNDYVPVAPDLAVEIVEDDDDVSQLRDKIADYLYYGTQMVVAIHLEVEYLDVHTPNGTQRLTINDTLDGGDVLPGFSLFVRTIFET